MTIHALIEKGVLVQDSRELEVHHVHSLRKLLVRYPDLAYGGRPAVNVLPGFLYLNAKMLMQFIAKII